MDEMHGNVWEWAQDCWHDSYDDAPRDGVAWEETGGECSKRVLRGGAWSNLPEYIRSATRYRFPPDYRGNFLGFRLAQDL